MNTLLPFTVKLYGSHVTASVKPLLVQLADQKQTDSKVNKLKKRIETFKDAVVLEGPED